MNAVRPAPVARLFARSARSVFPAESRAPMIPEPTIVVSSSPVPRPSAIARRPLIGSPRGIRSRPGEALSSEPAADPFREVLRGRFEGSHPLILGSGHAGRILQTPTDALRVSGKHRAGCGRPITDRDHAIESLTEHCVERLGPLSGHVETKQIGNGPPRERVDLGLRLTSRAFDLHAARGEVPQDRFGHLGSSRVPGAKKKDPTVPFRHPPLPPRSARNHISTILNQWIQSWVARSRRLTADSYRLTANYPAGNRTRNVLPRPRSLSTSTAPPCSWTRCLAIARPRP